MCRKPYILASTFLLVIFVLLGTLVCNTAYATQSSYVTMTQANDDATNLSKLGLFAGTDKGFDLEQAPVRLQGIIMLIKMMGDGEAALSCTYTHPFKDVPSWGDRYVAWAYAKGYTAGTSVTTFGTDDPMTAQQYIMFTMRALGYGNDVTYKNVIADAQRFGLIPSSAYNDASIPFLRADMVHISYLALQTNEKTSGYPLYMYLIDKGSIDMATAIQIFKPDLNAGGNSDSGESGNAGTGGVGNNGDLADFLGGGGGQSGTTGQSNTIEKFYSYTNTNNNKSSYTVAIYGNQILIGGIENEGLRLTVYLREIKSLSPIVGGPYDYVTAASKSIDFPINNFSGTLEIPDLKYGNYFELVVKVGGVSVMEKIWVKGTKDAWYFDGPAKIVSNDTLMKAADSYPLDGWSKLRTNVTEDFKNQIFSLMGSPASTNYDTAYNVTLWISRNVSYSASANTSSVEVIKNRKANCEGYSNLMADALAAYGIPARIVFGETLISTSANGFSTSGSAVNHAWVEFYDSASGKWIVCNPTGTQPPSCWFDMNRTFVANCFKVVIYK